MPTVAKTAVDAPIDVWSGAWATSGAAAVAWLIAAVTAFCGIRSAVLATTVEFGQRREATTLGLAFMLPVGVGALGAAMAGAVGNLDLHYPFLLAGGLAFAVAPAAAPALRR